VERVKAYVDGFNLYHGLKDHRPGTDASTCGWTCRHWLSASSTLLISADSDLCPAVRSLKRLNPGKRVIAVFPPRRHSEDLRKAANGMIKIYDVTVRNSQLPPLVATGITLTRLKHWTRA